MRQSFEEDRPARIIRDKKIPQLEKLTSPEEFTRAFEEFCRREYPNLGLKVKKSYISHVYHKPGKSCRMNIFIAGKDRERRTFERLFYAKISAKGSDRQSEAETFPEAWPGCGFWKPVMRWPEMNMLLQAFPYDPAMPYLGQLLEPEVVRRRVDANLSGFRLPAGWKCEDVIIHSAKYRNGKSCTLRYEATLVGPATQRKQIAFYGKTYASPRSQHVYRALQKIYASPASASGRLNIPALIAHLDDANTMWQHAWEGSNFSKVGEEMGWANLPYSGYIPKIANIMAALHQVEMPELTSGPSLASVIEQAGEYASDIVEYLPEKVAVLENITKKLKAAAPNLGKLPRTTIHGTFKVAQILCHEDQLALVDFDSIACGDPLYDVAEFLASIVYLRLSDDIPAAPVSECIESFLSHYQEQVPWPCERRRVAWYLVAFLLAKIHSSLKRARTLGDKRAALTFDLVEEWLEIVKRTN